MTYKDFKQILFTLPSQNIEELNSLKDKMNILGFSGGKDSCATAIIMHWLEIPFQTITAEVWWKEGISGEHPWHYDFLHNVAAPKLESWGVTSNFISSNITAYQYMTTPIVSGKHPERIGKLRGFPLCNRCGIQRDCKSRVCQRFYRKLEETHHTILGFASNEKDRILAPSASAHISILSMLDIHERQTYGICAQEQLLSPTYTFSERGGCWFCPNQKIQELELLYRVFPHLWQELMEIQRMPNKVQERFNRRQTLYDIEKEILNGVQIKFFKGNFFRANEEEEKNELSIRNI